MRRPARLFSIGLVLLSLGCAQRKLQRDCVPASLLRAGPLVDLNAPSDAIRPLDRPAFEALTTPGVCKIEPVTRHVLALSGGGKFGAYTVGVLKAWGELGTRPQFQIVTGVSTGAVIGTSAFLGGTHDELIAHLYTGLDASDVRRNRPVVALLWSDAVASSKPLEGLLEKYLDAPVIAEVAAAHAEGRRFYVGTTNLDTMKQVIWDMGAIASSGRPDAVELYRKIVLASASVPGFFPPVKIDVTVNGNRYSELHCDGGATSQVFVRAALLGVDEKEVKARNRPLANTEVHVIVSGKIYADPECTPRTIKGIATSASTALVYADARADIDRIYTLCTSTGMRFRVAALPQDFPIKNNSLEFKPDEMQRLFAEGYRQVKADLAWTSTPPTSEWNEGSIPRRGTDFLAPVEVIEARK